MKIILALLLSLFTLNAYAFEIFCYSGKNLLYHGFGSDLGTSEDLLGFMDKKTKHLVIVRGDCILIVEKDEKFSAKAITN